MAKGYWVTSYSKIKDQDKLAAYAELAGPAIEPYGGRYLARGTAVAAFEKGLKERLVISEFPRVEQAIAARQLGLVEGQDYTIVRQIPASPVTSRTSTS